MIMQRYITDTPVVGKMLNLHADFVLHFDIATFTVPNKLIDTFTVHIARNFTGLTQLGGGDVEMPVTGLGLVSFIEALTRPVGEQSTEEEVTLAYADVHSSRSGAGAAPNALWTLPKDVDFAVQTVTHVPKLRQAGKAVLGAVTDKTLNATRTWLAGSLNVDQRPPV
jgi:hypothetical protein